MATSTIDSFLLHGSGTSFAVLLPIKDYPDLGGTPEALDTTTLSDHIRTSVSGLQDLETMEFTCNYDLTNYNAIKALTGTQGFAVAFGKNETSYGGDGIFLFSGEIDVHISGSGVNEVREMVVTINRSTDITVGSAVTISA